MAIAPKQFAVLQDKEQCIKLGCIISYSANSVWNALKDGLGAKAE